MRLNRPPYWYWQLDRWVLFVACLLAVAALGIGLSGPGTPQIVAPLLTQPLPGQEFLAGDAVEISGLAGANDTVRFLDGDTLLGETVADDQGFFRWTLSGLEPGGHALTVETFDVEGTYRAASEPVPLTVVAALAELSTPPPVAPAGAMEMGAILSPGTTGTLTGKASPGDTIRILDGEVVLGETTAEETGNWRFALPVLSPGTHMLNADISGVDGQLRASPEPLFLTVSEQMVVALAPGVTSLPPVQPSPVVEPSVEPSRATAPLPVQPSPMIEPSAEPPPAIQPSVQPARTSRPSVGPSPSSSPDVDGAATSTVQADATAPAIATSAPSFESSPPLARPGAPVIIDPPANAVLLDTEPGFVSGTAIPGITIRVVEAERLVRQTVADVQGGWAVDLAGLAPGNHNLIALAIDEQGDQVGASAVLPLRIVEMVLPTVNQPAGGYTMGADQSGSVSGSAAPGATVVVREGDVLLGAVVANQDGRWRFTLPALAPGKHLLEVSVDYGANSMLTASEPLKVVVLSSRGAAVLESPEAGAIVTTRQPVFSGAATPGATVRLFDGATFIGETTADTEGHWAVRPGAPLANGKHEISIVAPGPDGATPVTSPPILFTVVATSLEATPLVAGTKAPELKFPAAGTSVATLAPTLTGDATPNSLLRIYDGAGVLGEAQADEEGEWQFRPSRPLREGAHTLTLVALDLGRKETVYSSEATLNIVLGAIDETAPPALLSALPSPSYNSRLSLDGITSPWGDVRIFVDDRLLGAVRADARGRWYFVFGAPLGAGKHTLRLAGVRTNNVEVFSAPFEFVIAPEATPIQPPSIKTMLGSQAGPGGLLQGWAPPGSEVQIYDMATFLGVASVRADGSWLFRLPLDLRDGPHEFRAAIITKDGYMLSVSPILQAPGSVPPTRP